MEKNTKLDLTLNKATNLVLGTQCGSNSFSSHDLQDHLVYSAAKKKKKKKKKITFVELTQVLAKG